MKSKDLNTEMRIVGYDAEFCARLGSAAETF